MGLIFTWAITIKNFVSCELCLLIEVIEGPLHYESSFWWLPIFTTAKIRVDLQWLAFWMCEIDMCAMLAPLKIVFHRWFARCMFRTHLFTTRSLVHIVCSPQPVSLVVLHHSPDRFGSSFHKNSITHTHRNSHAAFLPRTLRTGVLFAPAWSVVGGSLGRVDVKKNKCTYYYKIKIYI